VNSGTFAVFAVRLNLLCYLIAVVIGVGAPFTRGICIGAASYSAASGARVALGVGIVRSPWLWSRGVSRLDPMVRSAAVPTPVPIAICGADSQRDGEPPDAADIAGSSMQIPL